MQFSVLYKEILVKKSRIAIVPIQASVTILMPISTTSTVFILKFSSCCSPHCFLLFVLQAKFLCFNAYSFTRTRPKAAEWEVKVGGMKLLKLNEQEAYRFQEVI